MVENGKFLNRLRNVHLEKSAVTGICSPSCSPTTAKTPRKVHLRLRFQNPGKPRTAGLCGRAVGACDCGPLSCFLFRPRKRLEKRRKRSHTNVSNTLVARPSTPPAQTPQRSFRGTAAGTHLPSPTGSHTAAHTVKQGCFGRGWYHYPRSVPHVHKHPRAGCQNGVLCRFWGLVVGAPKERREPSGQRCAYARRCSEASRPRWAA